MEAPLIAIRRFHLIDAAKGAPGRLPRLRRGQAAGDVLVGQQIEMRVDFLASAVVAAAPEKHVQRARQQHAQSGHDRPPAGG